MTIQDLERCAGVNPLAAGLSASVKQAALEERFCYEQPPRTPYPCLVGLLRTHIFKIFVASVFSISALILTFDLFHGKSSRSTIVHKCKLISVPLVCLLFTWAHVWLCLQMMFYPLRFIPFFPCFRRCRTPIKSKTLDLPVNGWQGVIPNRIEKMARMACEVMIGNVITVEELLDRVTPEGVFVELRDSVAEIASTVLERIMLKRFPTAWEAFPASVKVEIRDRVVDEAKKTMAPAMNEFKANIHSIVDLKDMSIHILTNDPQVFIDIFKESGAREMSFLQHVAAVMGFLCGCVQLVIYVNVRGKWTDYWMLPLSGLIIGYFTNWLALKMTFSPVWPHMMCGGYINFQGVLMKRQKECAEKMAALVCSKVIDARAVLQFIIETSPDGAEKLMAMYQKHLSASVDQTVGAVRGLMPSFIGQGIEDLKNDVVEISLDVLPDHIQAVETYMDEVMKVQETLAWRLARLQPPEFERIIHPIFQEDEWLLFLIGGSLGVMVGLLQAVALMYIN